MENLVECFPALQLSLVGIEEEINRILNLEDKPISPSSTELLNAIKTFSSFLRDLFIRTEAAFKTKIEVIQNVPNNGSPEEEGLDNDDMDCEEGTDDPCFESDVDDLPVIHPDIEGGVKVEEFSDDSEDPLFGIEEGVEDESDEESSDSDTEWDVPSSETTTKQPSSRRRPPRKGQICWPVMIKDSFGKYPCLHPDCKYKAELKSAIRHHMPQKHNEYLQKELRITVPMHNCPKCSRSFLYRAGLRKHLDKHEKPQITKRKQWPAFPQDSSGQFRCLFPSCEKKSRLRNVVRNHMHQEHTDFLREKYGLELSKFICSTCSRGFTALALLKHHEQQHKNDRPFLCSQCGLSYKIKGNLNRHIKDAHADTKHTCPFCQKECKTQASLASHRLAFHSDPGERQVWLCSLCGAKLAREQSLKEHMRSVHMGLKPFPCVTCGSAFKSSSHLRRHIKDFCHGENKANMESSKKRKR